MFRRINIRRELDRQRESTSVVTPADQLLFQAYEVLYEDMCAEKDLVTRMSSSAGQPVTPPPRFLRRDRMYSIDQIRRTAIEHRLRFLDSRQFRQEIPAVALSRLRLLEKEAGVEFSAFKILAPSEAFELPHCEDDPLLFVQIGFKTWYLVDQWGSDLSWHRKLIYFPVRTRLSLFITVAVLALFFSALLPYHELAKPEWGNDLSAQLALFTWVFLCLGALLAYSFYAVFGVLSSEQWQHPFSTNPK